MKFDKKDLRILKCAMPDEFGYINSDRVLELMDLGYLHFNARKNWTENGYKITSKGTRLYNKWLKEIREKHGHNWMTYEEHCKDSGYHDEGDTYNKKERTQPYSMAYSDNFHNGFKCKDCGFEFCVHCYCESEIQECSEKSKGVVMSDDKLLDSSMVALDKSMRLR